MDTFEELNDLLADFGLGSCAGTLNQDREVLQEDNSTDVIFDDCDISVDARVEQYMTYTATPYIPSEQENEHTTVSAAEDQDDPQNDLEIIQSKVRNGCDCSKQCYNQFSERKILDHVLNLREMERNEKEMYIMGTIDKVACDAKRCKDGERKRTRWEYAYEGKKVCRNAFLLIFDIGRRTLEGILKHVSEHGVVPRVHGLTGKSSNNALPKEVIKDAVQFLVNYAAEEGLPQPAPTRGRDGVLPIYLPASNTKLLIHKEYEKACSLSGKRSAGLTTFKDVWNRCLPHIKIMSPRDDVCSKCEGFREEISRARSEDEKLSATEKYHQHVLDARAERAVYEQCVKESTEMFQQQPPYNHNQVHYTFDFSQYLKLPHHSREKGPTFFIQPRKVQLFGFRIDGYRQYNYLIDENQTIGQDGQLAHGPDCVISMLDDAFNRFTMQEEVCRIHADNCFGQNKNRYVLAYFSWRVMTGGHKSITYMMQIPGHTRCLIDAGFGRIKQLYRRSDVDTVDQAGEIVNRSSFSNEAVMFENGNWKWRQWKSFFGDRFKKVPNIGKYHSFRFTADEPGVVYMKVSASDEAEVRFVICKTNLLQMDPACIPPELSAGGLSLERHKYLYKHVRPLVRQQFQDSFCPPPISE